jgi:hypothetical protein
VHTWTRRNRLLHARHPGRVYPTLRPSVCPQLQNNPFALSIHIAIQSWGMEVNSAALPRSQKVHCVDHQSADRIPTGPPDLGPSVTTLFHAGCSVLASVSFRDDGGEVHTMRAVALQPDAPLWMHVVGSNWQAGGDRTFTGGSFWLPTHSDGLGCHCSSDDSLGLVHSMLQGLPGQALRIIVHGNGGCTWLGRRGLQVRQAAGTMTEQVFLHVVEGLSPRLTLRHCHSREDRAPVDAGAC